MKNLSRLLLLSLFSFTTFAFAGGDNKIAQISFHVETEASDNPKMIFQYELAGKQRYFRRMPEISSKDFVSFNSFPADDQTSYGVLIQLKESSGKRLTAVTTAEQGKYMVCQAFGRVVDALTIDQPVNDRVIIVWKGLTLDEIRELDKVLPRIGQEKEKKNKKD
ncbi:MAG: hypothetical protein ACK46A_07500 [Akkermansiaceae bacterium]|jgi:hypothetical protein|nr:hypothetical protein [Luteolibacter sp.]